MIRIPVLAMLGFTFVSSLLHAQAISQEEINRRKAHAERVRQRQEEFYRTRAYPMQSIPAGARLAAIAEMERMIVREKAEAGTPGAANWVLIGPRPLNTLPENAPSGAGAPYAAGRVAALAVDPRNANTAYAGASGGGVWKTTDGGQNWIPLTDDQPSMATGSIALAPSNPDVVYVGTGEANNSGDSYYGAGILKSTNGGATWTQITGPFVGPFGSSRVTGGGARIPALAVHPTDPNMVLAGVDRAGTATSGIYRSTDGGANWTLVLSGAVGSDVVFNPSDPTIVYAALGTAGTNTKNGVYKSTDGGVTWNLSGGSGATALPTTNVGRIALAIAPSSPNTIYAGIQSTASGGLLGLFKSTDGAQTWNRLASPDYCTPQCSYDNVIRVHPTNPNLVIAAGLPPYRSLDGGISWANIAVTANGLASHTDHHALAFSSDGSRLYDGNDGGVFSITNLNNTAAAWADLNATLAITEFSTNVSINPSNPQIAYGGTQDNGTLGYTGNLAWDQLVGGDGGTTAIDFAVPNIWYGVFPGPEIYKLSGVDALNGGVVAPYITTSGIFANGITLAGERFSFYGPLVVDPSNPVNLYYASQRLWRSTDSAGTWSAISGDLTGGNSIISTITVSPSNPLAVAVGTNNGRIEITDDPQPGPNTWAERFSGLPGRAVSRIVFDPLVNTTLYATFSGFSGFLSNDHAGHVFKTTDYGQTWTDISGNLPNIPVDDIVLDPDLPGTLYLATDIGVFQSTNDGQSWSTLSSGLPRVLVSSLNLHRASRTLRAVTYGRSMWDLSVPLPGASVAPHIDSLAPAAVATSTATANLTLTGSNFASNSVVRWNGANRPTTFVNGTTLRVALPASDTAKAGRATIAVFNPASGGGLSNVVNVPVGTAPSFTISGITSAANPATAGPLVPGGITSLYGTNLAADTVIAAAPPLPYTLGGVTVEVNGIPAALFFVSPTQVNFQVPWELEGFNRATVDVVNGTQVSATVQVPVAISAPTLFSTTGAGTGQAAALIAGTSTIAAPAGAFPGSRPARRGEILEIYGTGLGPVSRLQGDGQPKTNSPTAITQTPLVTIGGIPATVLFSGLTPGGVGLYQIDVAVPSNAPVGDTVAVLVTLLGASSNQVTVAVQ